MTATMDSEKDKKKKNAPTLFNLLKLKTQFRPKKK